jgi:hypothetical protein
VENQVGRLISPIKEGKKLFPEEKNLIPEEI